MFERSYETFGFFIFPDFLNRATSNECCASLDGAEQMRQGKDLSGLPVFDDLIVSERVLRVVHRVLGLDILFHHANGRRLPPRAPGKEWHHDYDGSEPWALGEPGMCHLMFYPAGLSEQGGPLELVPRSHLIKAARSEPRGFGQSQFEGSVTVLGEPGLMVLMNSSLWHRRVPSHSNRPRYYFNLSYCQRGRRRPERGGYSQRLRQAAERHASGMAHGDVRLFDIEDNE